MKKVYLIMFFILLIGIGSAGVFAYKHQKAQPKRSSSQRNSANSAQQQVAEQSPTSVRLIASGDMIAHDSVNQNAKNADGSYDYLKLMNGTQPYFSKADIRFCNQSTAAGGEQFGISGYPVFNAPVEFSRGIEGLGCNLINIGSNHSNDKGQGLIDATVAAWDNRESILAVAGANRSAEEQAKVRTFTVNGMRFAYVSYTTYTNKPLSNNYGVNMYNDALASSQITEAKKQADFIIVSMRWGTEYSPAINTQQDQIAQKLADLGANVILGHGPHVLQPVKRLQGANGNETLVWYSLGNFLNTQIEIESLIGGLAVMDIDVASHKITNVSFMPVYMHYEWSAEQKKRQSKADLLARTNLAMVPLDKATELMAKSQNNTTIEAQTERVKTLLNQFTSVPIINSAEY